MSEPKVFASCWSCNKEYDISRWSNKYGVKCDAAGCDGYVISLSGKVQSRIEGDFSNAPDSILKVMNKLDSISKSIQGEETKG